MKFSAEEVFAEIERQAPEYGVDPKIAKAFLLAENTADGSLKPGATFNGAAVSHKKARGIFQTLESTDIANQKAGFLDPKHRFDSRDLRGQVRAGMASLKEMSSRLKNPNDVFELGAMYNGGTAPWKAYREGNAAGIPLETRNYFTKLKTALGLEKPGMTPQQMEQAAGGGGTAVAQPPQQAAGAASSSSSTSRSTRTNFFDPELMASAIATGWETVKAGGSFDNAITAINQSAVARKQAEAAQAAAISQYALDVGGATTAAAAVDASAAQLRKNILQAGNIDPTQINNRVNQAFDTINSTDMQLEPLGQEIDRRMAVGFFDNPLEWLVNQTRLPGMVGQYNSIARQQNRAIQSAKELQSLAAAQQSLSAATDADGIAAAGLAKAKAQASQAQLELTKLQTEQAGAAARDAANIAALAGQKTSMLINLTQLTKQVMSENEGMSERDAARQAEQIQVDSVNKYLKMVGSNLQYTPAQFKAIPAGKRDALLNASGKNVIAEKFSEAADTINAVGNLNNIAAGGDAGAANWFRKTLVAAQQRTNEDLKAAEASAKLTGKVLKREEFLAGNLDKIQEIYVADLKDMRTAQDANPYKIDYVTMAKKPEFKDNPLAQYIAKYGPTGENLFQKVDEKYILDRFTASAVSGAIPVKDASKAISDFYKRAIDVQAETTKYGLFGLNKPTSYVVKVPATGVFSAMFSGSAPQAEGTVDLANPAAVETYLTKNVAAVARVNMSNQLTIDALTGTPGLGR